MMDATREPRCTKRIWAARCNSFHDHFFKMASGVWLCDNQPAMAILTVPTVTAMEAQAEASLFLSDRLPDRISASAPSLDEAAQVWRVPVILAYPYLGVLGQVGEIVVSTTKAEVISSTPVEEMLQAASALAEKHRNAIEAPLP